MTEYVLMLDVDGVLVTAGPNGGSWSDQLEADLGIPKRDFLDAFFPNTGLRSSSVRLR